ncbi:hypothetical protein L227DRAFT_617787 [Lentinus tigrinus ALCF2SS1-6]|uniref:Uncharacterized protein n=1 Tax=Lentinus tigrinus ALCF2SS1-6 TaxID=1328759 RepID=A0A5C2RPM0_9APHY|nr:hypothetical protein L227DRAFT_617787 [Lentinus tigrinus ALCF2SS1-6]
MTTTQHMRNTLHLYAEVDDNIWLPLFASFLHVSQSRYELKLTTANIDAVEAIHVCVDRNFDVDCSEKCGGHVAVKRSMYASQMEGRFGASSGH